MTKLKSRVLVRSLLLLIVTLFFSMTTSAVNEAPETTQFGHIRLLAVTERDNATFGSVADLSVSIVPGQGRVFLETFPLTRESTQISLRFAQQVACKTLEIDCRKKDFLFTIHAVPGIVGGPSAGSAATVLIAAVLKNVTIQSDVAITGTINSGGIIGMVGGIREKIVGASRDGVRTVLIPKGSRRMENATDLVEYGAGINVSVIEISTIEDALEVFTGFRAPVDNASFVQRDSYVATMKTVAVDLCDRARTLVSGVGADNVSQKLLVDASDSFNKQEYYASASYCFRAAVGSAIILGKNSSQIVLEERAETLKKEITQFERQLDAREIGTITDLQTIMLVKERLADANEQLSRITSERVAYAVERVESAKKWALFFGKNDDTERVTNEQLASACEEAIAKSQERYNYVTSILPDRLEGTEKSIEQAYVLQAKNDFSGCLYVASKAKAESDALLGLLGVAEKDLEALVQLKLRIVEKGLVHSQKKGIFPLIGYSYYEYAKALWNTDKQTAILFVEYALEFTNLDVYFSQRVAQVDGLISPEETNSGLMLLERIGVRIDIYWIVAFAGGILIGFLIDVVVKTRARPLRALRGKKR